MPRAVFTISGDITAFDRVDNVYNALKREGVKLLENWEIRVVLDYHESQAEQVPVR